MIGGYTGKILNINLNSKEKKITKLDKSYYEKFIGAKGLGAKLLIDMLPEKTNPLAPMNFS